MDQQDKTLVVVRSGKVVLTLGEWLVRGMGEISLKCIANSRSLHLIDVPPTGYSPVARYLSLGVPTKANADGLIACLGNAQQIFGIDNILDRVNVLGVQGKPILIGGGTDGASVNIAKQNGMKGKLQKELPRLHWTWCYADHLELACKDAFSSQLFKDIAEMLLRLYYVYAKSPKKLRELADIVDDLKEVGNYRRVGTSQ